MKIACVQYGPAYRTVSKNFERVRQMVHKTDADAIVLPELAYTGYFFRTKDEIAPLAETVDGPLCAALSRLAREENKAILTGFLEASNGRFYNSAVAFDSEGHRAGHYRKVHLFYFETRIFERGDLGFPVFPLRTRAGELQAGMLICYDWRFPEAARVLALGGAELIAMPSNIVTTTGMLHATLQVRAFENKVPIAFADRTGSETNGEETLVFRGESAIVGMNGELLKKASGDADEIIVAELDPASSRSKRINPFNDLFLDRAPR